MYSGVQRVQTNFAYPKPTSSVKFKMHVNPCGKSGEWRWIGDPAANLIWRRGALRRGDSTETETEDERPKMRREEWRKYADHYRGGKGKLLGSVWSVVVKRG